MWYVIKGNVRREEKREEKREGRRGGNRVCMGHRGLSIFGVGIDLRRFWRLCFDFFFVLFFKNLAWFCFFFYDFLGMSPSPWLVLPFFFLLVLLAFTFFFFIFFQIGLACVRALINMLFVWF